METTPLACCWATGGTTISKAVWDFDRAPWRNRPAFCLDLRITYGDGSVETIPTDLSWRTSSGAIIFNSI